VASVQYSKRIADHWFILSAKYGTTEPDRRIEPYDQQLIKPKKGHFGLCECPEAFDRTTVPIRARDDLKIVVLAGKVYYDSMHDWMKQKAILPMAGLQLGERLQWLNKQNSGNETQRLLFD